MNDQNHHDIFTLVCHKHMPMAQITIPGILKFLSAGQRLVIFDDGTLAKTDVQQLCSLSPVIKVITREERESIVIDAIGNRPNCLKYRDEYPPAFKLLDVPIIAQKTNSRLTFTDSDIIYLQNCNSYFEREVNTFLKTDAIKLSFKLKAGLLKYNWKIPMRFNSGYFSFGLQDYDLDFLEFYLGLPDIRNIFWLTEQTGWALLFGKAGKAFCPDDSQFICKEQFDGPTSKTLAIHLIANLKSKYIEWSLTKDLISAEHPLFETSRNVTIIDWIKKSANRIFK